MEMTCSYPTLPPSIVLGGLYAEILVVLCVDDSHLYKICVRILYTPYKKYDKRKSFSYVHSYGGHLGDGLINAFPSTLLLMGPLVGWFDECISFHTLVNS